MEKAPLGIFGAGWVGLVTAACFADRGHSVVVRDVVPERIQSLNDGRLPFHEPGLADLIERNRERLTFTLDVGELKAGTDLFFACVDTPPTASGDADLTYVWSVIDDLGDPGEAVLVMKSTVPVGTGERIRAALDQRGLEKVGYVSNPEFLSEGRAVEDFTSPDRVVIGSFAEADGDRVAALYDGFESPIVRMTVPSAEMVKLAANAFLATRISFINEIANVSEAVGANVDEVALGMGLDQRIGTRYLNPGIGYGGSCFPKDVSFLKLLAGNSGYHFQLVSAVIDVNDLQKRRVVQKLQDHLGSLRGKKIALLGLAFKPNTDDMREAPSIVIANRLVAEGAHVRGWDPIADAAPVLPRAVEICRTPFEGRCRCAWSAATPMRRSSPNSCAIIRASPRCTICRSSPRILRSAASTRRSAPVRARPSRSTSRAGSPRRSRASTSCRSSSSP